MTAMRYAKISLHAGAMFGDEGFIEELKRFAEGMITCESATMNAEGVTVFVKDNDDLREAITTLLDEPYFERVDFTVNFL